MERVLTSSISFSSNAARGIVPRSPPLAAAHGNNVVFNFLVAYYQHVRYALHLRLANLEAYLFIAQVRLHADAQLVKAVGNLLCGLMRAVCHCKHLNLHRSKPGGECAREMLGYNAYEALYAASTTR